MPVALPILGAFALGLAARGRWDRHFPVLFRASTAGGVAAVAFLAGWGFTGTGAGLAPLAAILAAQMTAVAVGALAFRDRADGPLMAFQLYGNPGFWSVPVTALVLDARAALLVEANELLFQPRLAAGLRLLRGRAPRRQSPRTALADYSPMAAAAAGLALSLVAPAPGGVAGAVVALTTVMAAVGAVMLGLAWPRGGWLRAGEARLVARVLALHLTVVPALLLAVSAAGVAVPAGAWILALSPFPVASLSYARLYGYSTRLAACGLAISVPLAAALVPVAAWLAANAPA